MSEQMTPVKPNEFDFAAWFQTFIQALTKPAVQTFDALTAAPGASPRQAYIWMAIAGAISGLFALFIGGGFFGIFTAALFAVIGLWVDAWLINLFAAKVFKGSGEMNTLIYALATFAAPIYAVSGLLGIVPVIGGFLTFVLALYALYLSVLAVQSVYKLDMGKAAGAILIPAAIVFAVVFLFLLIFGALFAAIFGLGIPLGGL